MTTTTEDTVRTEQHMVAGDRLVERITDLVRQGNIRCDAHRSDDNALQDVSQQTIGILHSRLFSERGVQGAKCGLTRGRRKVEQDHIRPGDEFRRRFHVHNGK